MLRTTQNKSLISLLISFLAQWPVNFPTACSIANANTAKSATSEQLDVASTHAVFASSCGLNSLFRCADTFDSAENNSHNKQKNKKNKNIHPSS